MSYVDHVSKHVRITVLRVLMDAPGCEANDSILCDAVEERGHKVSRDFIRNQMGWLSEQGLVTQRDLGALKIVTLTGRGLDVAKGKAIVDGVKQPTPGG